MNSDTSSSTNTRHKKAQTLHIFHLKNPNMNEAGRLKTLSASINIVRNEGSQAWTTVRTGTQNNVENCCTPDIPVDCSQYAITNYSWDYNAIISPIPLPYQYGFAFNYDPLPGNPILSVTIDWFGTPDTSFSYFFPYNGRLIIYTMSTNVSSVNLTATYEGCAPITASQGVCFLEGALVTMADRRNIGIENVKIGDKLLGAFGEINTVVALHRPKLNDNTMTVINGEHHTSSHHPHISPDKKFYAAIPNIATKNTYGRTHTIIDKNGNEIQRYLEGLKVERLHQLVQGQLLQTINGPKKVEKIINYNLSPDTQLYNLVLDGSHTFYVDGYAVTGWPSESDFDYDKWVPK